MLKQVLTCLCLVALTTVGAMAQANARLEAQPEALQPADSTLKQPALLGLGLEAWTYRGDLGPYRQYKAGLRLSFVPSPHKKVHGSFATGLGSLQEQNPNLNLSNGTATANRFFNTPLWHVHYALRVRLWQPKRLPLSIIISQGIGLMGFNPQDSQGNPLADQLSTRPFDETYGSTTVVLPTRLELLYALNQQWLMALNAGFWNPQTDYLDNIGTLGPEQGNDNALSVAWLLYYRF